MKHITYIVLLIATIGCATRDPRLYGTWKSDRDVTMLYNQANSMLTDSQIDKYRQIFGRITLEFRPDGTIHFEQNPYTMTVGTNSFPVKGISATRPYTIIAKDKSSVVIRAPDILDEQKLSHIHFEGTETFWRYLGSEDMLDNLHMREYFKKQ